jgi:hypothetical protein
VAEMWWAGGSRRRHRDLSGSRRRFRLSEARSRPEREKERVAGAGDGGSGRARVTFPCVVVGLSRVHLPSIGNGLCTTYILVLG